MALKAEPLTACASPKVHDGLFVKDTLRQFALNLKEKSSHLLSFWLPVLTENKIGSLTVTDCLDSYQ